MIDFFYLFNSCVGLLGYFAGEMSYVAVGDKICNNRLNDV